jgi:hypothetical protein
MRHGPIITDHTLYRALGSTMQAQHTAYQDLCQYHIDVGLLQEIRAILNQCRVLGTERFKDL